MKQFAFFTLFTLSDGSFTSCKKWFAKNVCYEIDGHDTIIELWAFFLDRAVALIAILVRQWQIKFIKSSILCKFVAMQILFLFLTIDEFE